MKRYRGYFAIRVCPATFLRGAIIIECRNPSHPVKVRNEQRQTPTRELRNARSAELQNAYGIFDLAENEIARGINEGLQLAPRRIDRIRDSR